MFTTSPSQIDGIRIRIKVGFLIRNQGPGIASNVFITILVYEFPGEDGSISFQPQDSQNWSGSWSFGRHLSLIAKDGVKLPPNAHFQPVIMEAAIEPPFDKGLRIECTVGSAESEPHMFSLICDTETINKLYRELIDKASKGKLTKKDRFNFTSRFLNLKKDEFEETQPGNAL